MKVIIKGRLIDVVERKYKNKKTGEEDYANIIVVYSGDGEVFKGFLSDEFIELARSAVDCVVALDVNMFQRKDNSLSTYINDFKIVE